MALGKKGKADGRVKPIENQITHIVRAFSELHYNQRKKIQKLLVMGQNDRYGNSQR